MNERVLLAIVAIRYLVIAVALLHTSLGAKPTLRVVYRLDDVDNKNELECIVGIFLLPGATFTFKDPKTKAVEAGNVMEGRFTIHPSNESLVTCTIDSEESDPVRVAAIPQYTAGVQTIGQYVYSDSESVDIECPFEIGRLRELHGFSWDGVTSDGLRGSLTNGNRGVYWLAEEDNRILHVDISAAGYLRNFECVGTVQTCTGSTSCTTRRRNSPTITIINNITRPSIMESPANVMVNERDPATFTCSANGSGELTIEWICSDSTICGSSTNDEGADGRITSTYEITSASASLNITCVVNQSLASFMSEESDFEIRLPRTEPLMRTAKLTVIPAPTIAITTTLPDSQQPGVPGLSESENKVRKEITNPNNQLIIIILAIVLVFIIISIVILGACTCYIFCYHYRNGESCLSQQLRQTFSCCSIKRDPLYAIPTDISESATEGNHDTQQVPQREVTIAVAHPINYQTRMLMQENTAYGTDIAIAPEIAAERNVAYGHMSYDKKAASENSGTIGHQLLQHFDTNEVEMEHLINQQDELGSTTDVTSSTTYSAIFPCPITMNLSGTGVETLV